MTEARYIYCIVDSKQNENVETVGILSRNAFMIKHKDIGAVVSTLPLKEIEANVENITIHQQVVEASRTNGTVLPVRFGIIIKTDEGVKNLLMKSYKEFKSKIDLLKDKDEYGVKVVLDKQNLKKLQRIAQDESDEIKGIKKELLSAKKGTAYFLQMRMNDAVKNETLRRIDRVSGDIQTELGKVCDQNCILRTDIEQIILNSAYLVSRGKREYFMDKVEDLKQKYGSNGFIFHISGPWAPYSFC